MAGALFRRRLGTPAALGFGERPTVLTLTGHTGLVNAVAMTPDGRCAISASADYTLRVWDIESGISIAAFTGESPMLRCALAPDGRTIIAREKSGPCAFFTAERLGLGAWLLSA